MSNRGWRALALVLCSSAAFGVTACGSSDSGSGGGATTSGDAGSAVPAAAAAAAEKATTPATKIAVVQAGLKPFSPKPGAKIVNISCDVSITGCNAISNGVKAGVQALGYEYTRCDAGKTPDRATSCFTNAVNAKPDAIIVNAVGTSVAADGYAAAKKAGIPVVGLFTGDGPGAGGAAVQVGAGGCVEQGKLMADSIAVQSKGKADILFATESSIGCSVARTEGFKAELPKACPECKVKELKFNSATMQQSLPQQLQAELNQNPGLTWIVGVFDSAAAIANTQVAQAGKQDQISVGGMDADPANIEVMLKKGIQKLDVAFAFGETPWAAADAAARIYSGEDVPDSVPANIFVVNQDNTDKLPPTKVWDGPTDYQDQFKALWSK
jgi:ribose transport system substrate-binding protein